MPGCNLSLAKVPGDSLVLYRLQTSVSGQWLLCNIYYWKDDKYKCLTLISFASDSKLLAISPVVDNNGVLIQPVIHTDL